MFYKKVSFVCGGVLFSFVSLSTTLFSQTANINIDGKVGSELQKVLTMGAEQKAQAFKSEENALQSLQDNQNAWAGNAFALPTSTSPISPSAVVAGSSSRPFTAGSAVDLAATSMAPSGTNSASTAKGVYDEASQKKIKELEARALDELAQVQEIKRTAVSGVPLSDFRGVIQKLVTSLDTLEKIKQSDPQAVSMDVADMWSSVDAICATTSFGIAQMCKQTDRGVDNNFYQLLTLKDNDKKDNDKKDGDKDNNDEQSDDPNSSEDAKGNGADAVKAACGGAFGGNDGSPSVIAKLTSSACTQALNNNPELSAKVGAEQVLAALQKWRSYAQGARKNFLMLSGIGIERLYDIGIVIYPGLSQAAVGGLIPSPAVAVQQEHKTATQIATPEALEAGNQSTVANVKTDRPMTDSSSYTD